MNEQFFIFAGGIGNRLKCLNIPKALAPIPVGKGMEPILSRIQRLIRRDDFTLCLGWEAQLFNERWPDQEKMITYDPANPTGAAECLRLILNTNYDRYTVLLGDVVWSKAAMTHFLDTRMQADIVFYHDRHPSYSETYALSISASVRDQLLADFNVETIPALPSCISKYHVQEVAFTFARLGGIEKLIDESHRYNKKRINKFQTVDDIDTDEQYLTAIKNIIGGMYDA